MKANVSSARLPPELLSQIFILCLSNYPSPIKTDAPLNISTVCKEWRQISISTSQLWSHILLLINDKRQGRYAPLIETRISRSRECGFSFVFRWELCMARHSPGLRAMTDVLIKNCGTWRNVVITGPCDHQYFIRNLVSVIPAQTPDIQKIHIDADSSINGLFNAPLPHLKHLSMRVTVSISPGSSHLRLENLQSLSLQGADLTELLECLSRSPRLVTAKLQIIFHEGYSASQNKQIDLLRLKTLDIDVRVHGDDDMEAERNFSEILERLQVPALKSLFINLDYLRYGAKRSLSWEPLITLVSHSNATLQSLEIRGANLISTPQFLAAFPNIGHLGITADLLEYTWNHGLIYQSTSSLRRQSLLCPNLESLRVFCGDDADRALTAIRSVMGADADVEGSRPLCLIKPFQIHASVELPSHSTIQIVDEVDWITRHKHDLYADLVWD
ncbi:hypothetical protein BD410DRAFT_545838 [Rickenella mellea]|uniref:F-box domain-containing protein n=1 Tax=Rickenella mellea TaxID=50990 RepID=A0A4Y7PSL8_9AGAM|nr:hypothetical protein BD410DRAFT_545838 [Rickenella mellea]